MKFPITLLGAALYLFSSVEAGISTTNPFQGITWNGGETKTITWNDDGNAPKLQDIGETNVDLMVGGPKSQFLADNIGKTLATTGKINYNVPKDVGPPGDFYFIKYTAGENVFFSGSFTIKNVNGVIADFDPKNPDGNATATTAASSSAASPSDATSSPSATSQDPYATGGGTSTPDSNSAASGSSSASPSSDSSSTSGAGNSLPSQISNNNGNNLLPSFIGVATAAIALTFTYLY